jgi:cell shape-determining protein MreC
MIPPAIARQMLPASLIVLGIIAFFVPTAYLSYFNGVGRLSQTLVAPVSGPLHKLVAWLAPPGGGPRDSTELRQLKQEAEEFHVQLLQALVENDRLRDQIKDLQRGRELDPDLAIQQITVPVLGSASDVAQGQLTVRAGSRQGVDTNTVATASGLQLVGRVISVGSLTSTVAPITSRAAGTLRAVIMLDDTTNGLICTLAAGNDGLLSGDVEDRRDPTTGQAIQPTVGQEVRLSDPSHWPRSAQMLLIGKIEKVEPSPKQPLRKVVTVRPSIDSLERVAEVVMRIVPGFEQAQANDPKPKRRAEGGP